MRRAGGTGPEHGSQLGVQGGELGGEEVRAPPVAGGVRGIGLGEGRRQRRQGGRHASRVHPDVWIAREEVPGVLGQLEALDVHLLDRDPGLQALAVRDQQHRVLGGGALPGAELEVVGAGAIGDELADVRVGPGHARRDVGEDAGRRRHRRAPVSRAAASRPSRRRAGRARGWSP